VTYFPVPANPVDFALASSYVEVLTGAAGSTQTVYPYVYSSSTGQLTPARVAWSGIHNGAAV